MGCTELYGELLWEWKAEGVEQLRLSTVDLTGVPSLENRASSVYVHCKAGRCRSATLAAAYIVQIHCWGPEEACQMLAPIRPHVIICSTQLETLRRYHQKVCGGGFHLRLLRGCQRTLLHSIRNCQMSFVKTNHILLEEFFDLELILLVFCYSTGSSALYN
ncbi:phosphatidylglycerophosphatase and protein-tyrosine phosphatase 1-like [Oncorhynchus mykiss]|uniref:phosphatidylglycerophosphatase and protein-tyrosine phosphatase 1-like n=1 Tax=Oncorhynchus mykiss TaxID=8022 RepID=UPI0018778967|nr:phosphatidylglycerophosphatase and protein-tyrosine phosphatase 1-like [Oncorhynchus mykiss]